MEHCFRLWVVSAAVMVVTLSQPQAVGETDTESVTSNTSDAPQAASLSARQLPTLQRMVRHFDFEEAERAPFEMPLNFYRYGADEGAAAQGFPPFGTMRLTNEVAYSGNWSFEFSLDGGSLAARVPTAVLPVVPLADYAVTARVRTEGLKLARARIVAWLYDAHGEAIESSRTVSELIETGGEWEAHTIEVRGDFEHAADMVIELQLLQPRQFVERGADPSLLLDDVSGRAWFDDVTIWHLPRIDISTEHPGNAVIVEAGYGRPSLTVLVRDLAHEDLYARLRIFDIEGNSVHDERFAAPRMPRPRTVNLPPLPNGWYRAVLDLTSGADSQQVIAMQWVDIALLAPPMRPTSRPDARFGVVLDEDWIHHAQDVPAIVERLGAGSVVLPMWTGASIGPMSDILRERMRRAVSRLVAQRLHLTMALESVPGNLAEALDVSPDNVLGAFARHAALPFPARERGGQWREALGPLLDIGMEMHRWQLGSTEVAGSFEHANLQQLVEDASRGVRLLASAPMVSVPFLAEQFVKADLQLAARSIRAPYELRPDAIGAYVELWRINESPYCVTWQQSLTKPAGPYAQRERAVDLFHRALHAVRFDVPAMNIDAPWTYADDGRCSPDPTFIVWRQLADHLHGRRFAGKMDLGESKVCWLFQGQREGDDMLVAWSRSDADELVMQLADDAVTVVDLFGNATEVPLTGERPGKHRIGLTRTPVFIEGIHLPLVQFRGAFALEDSFIPAEHRTHRHELVLQNPWDMPLSGTLQIVDKPQWRITPRSHDFTIAARGEVRLPVEITFDRSIVSGETTIQAEAFLQADGTYRLGLSAPIRVGLPHLEFSATWRIVTNAETGRDDLVITQYVTNTAPAGSEPVYADAIVLAPGVRQERRLIAGLEPGQMAIRMFQIRDGASLLAGQTVRVSLSDRNSLGRLNRELYIPAMRASVGGAERH